MHVLHLNPALVFDGALNIAVAVDETFGRPDMYMCA